MSYIQLQFDEVCVAARRGQTVLEAALENGIHIPYLCHDPRLKPTGGCGLCLVEIDNVVQKACTTRVVDGMHVKTKSDTIIERRKKRLDEIFADHWADCIAPCTLACPAGTDAQAYIGLIAQKRYRDAVIFIKQTNPMPSVIGRICTRPCEDSCRRNLVDERVSICFLKRFVADKDIKSADMFKPEMKPSSGKKVAIIGGGPAGLSAAYYLTIEGHKAIIFEAMPKLGGMLRYGIPAYRLPKDVLDREIATITNLGVEVKTNQALGRDFTLEDLRRDFDAVFLGIGAQKGVNLGISGEDSEGVLSGVGFLRDIGLGKKIKLGERVAVIGGGNTAIDAARSALRLGAKEVNLIYRRSRNEMPAHDIEIEEAEHEGVKLTLLASPTDVLGNGRVEGLRCIRMVLGRPDESGRRRPEQVTSSEFVVDVDTVIAAIGQAVDGSSLNGVMSDRKRIAVDPSTMQSGVEGVFAGGDAVTGPNTAIDAIAAGRKAALAIIKYLSGEKIDLGPDKPFSAVKTGVTREDLPQREVIRRVAMPAIPLSKRDNFDEVELGYSEKQALEEAMRCMECGCIKQNQCHLRKLAIKYEIEPNLDGKSMRHFTIDDHHPVILRDMNKCIRCQNCVNICGEVVQADALVYDEINDQITTAGGMPLIETSCEACGQCLSVCPTAAMIGNRQDFTREYFWPPKVVETTCGYCGVGCQMELNIDGAGKVFRVTSKSGRGVNEGNLCAKGRFGFKFISHPDRLTSPLIKKDGQFVKASWDEAINLIATKLFEIKEAYGPDSIAGLASARCTNEENYLFQKFMRAVIGTNNIDHCARL